MEVKSRGQTFTCIYLLRIWTASVYYPSSSMLTLITDTNLGSKLLANELDTSVTVLNLKLNADRDIYPY